MKLLKLTFLAVILMAASQVFAQTSPLGVWKTIDDESGDAKSHVEIFEQDGKLHGKIIKLLEAATTDTCDKCPGDKKDKPLVGMIILENLKPYKYYWKYGKIMDPKSGSEYKCSIWFEEGKSDELKVRGKHWTGLYRTQIWYKVK